MTDADRQLVDLITEQVIAVLRQRGLLRGGSGASSAPTPSPSHAAPAPIRPPIGVCTGDYSQFPELQGRLYAQPAPATNTNAGATHTAAAPQPTASAPLPAHPAPLTGIITANQLQSAMTASPDGVALLSPDARLTPLANDLARQHPERIRRGGAASQPASRASSPDGAADTRWLWWIEGQCSAVAETVRSQQGWLQPLAAGPHSSALPQVVRNLADLLRGRQIAGAILFVPNAARAMCYANRCAAVRAVVGTCGEAVEQGIRDIGANVLVIEYPHHGPRAMTAMVQRIMQQSPAAPAAIERELADLHRC